MRSYRGPNSYNLQTAINSESVYLGPAQVAWLTRAFEQSTAAWKAIAAGMTVWLKDWNNAVLWSVDLAPAYV